MDQYLSVFSSAELSAMRLDGELFRLDAGWSRVDEVDTPMSRARLLLAEAPPRLIVERLSAAWVWGALPRPPEPPTLCFAVAERSTKLIGSAWSVRNTQLQPAEVWRAPGAAVTTPWRTLVDLIRLGDLGPPPAGGAVVLALLACCRLSLAEAIDRSVEAGTPSELRFARALGGFAESG